MSIRKELGDFSSIVCFKGLITGVEDTLGADGAAVVFVRAGKVRGQVVAKELGLVGKNLPVNELAATLNNALGKNGTKLCSVTNAYEQDGNVVIETQETVCSAGEPSGSDRTCTYTLGAIWGALETVTGKVYQGKHTDSVLRGGSSDKFVFSPM